MVEDLLRPQHLVVIISLLAVPMAVIVAVIYAIRGFRRNTPPARVQ
jgi:hypothetical protein